ncbi:MAG: LptF/LptG family permease [Rhizobacter sp.]|nr:LptF/LptG family permease [Chlorobiales bacterium]
MKILYRHILRAHIGPFCFAFLTVIFVFTLQIVTRLLDQIVGKGLETGVIIELFVLQIAWMVVLAAPMAVLVSTLMAFGDLSNSMEMTAIRASGISLFRLMLPVLICAALLTFLVERFGNVVLPEANHRAKILRADIVRKKPNSGITAGVFYNQLTGYSILARETDSKTSAIRGVTIYDLSKPQKHITITAASGTLTFTGDYQYLVLTLNDGEMHELDLITKKTYRKITFKKHREVLRAVDFGFARSSANDADRSDRELSAAAMLGITDSLHSRIGKSVATMTSDTKSEFYRLLIHPTPTLNIDSLSLLPPPTLTTPAVAERLQKLSLPLQLSLSSQTDSLRWFKSLPVPQRLTALERALVLARRTSGVTDVQLISISNDEDQVSRYMVEVHKKYAIPFACFFFVLVGVPLGILAKRGGFGVGAGLSLAFFILYWGFLIGGEKLADRGFVSAGVAMWLGNAVIFLIGLVLIVQVSGTNLPRIIRGWLPRAPLVSTKP